MHLFNLQIHLMLVMHVMARMAERYSVKCWVSRKILMLWSHPRIHRIQSSKRLRERETRKETNVKWIGIQMVSLSSERAVRNVNANERKQDNMQTSFESTRNVWRHWIPFSACQCNAVWCSAPHRRLPCITSQSWLSVCLFFIFFFFFLCVWWWAHYTSR